MIKQNDKITLDIINLGSGGEGVAKFDGYTIFVKNCLVGEKVVARVTYAKGTVGYADVVEVITASQNRAVPLCKYYGKCGGCQLQHMSLESQLLYKGSKVTNNLAKLGGINADVACVTASANNVGYRNKIALPVGGKVGKVAIGMYMSSSHDIVTIDKCLLVGQWGNDVVDIVRCFANSSKIVPYNEKNNSGVLRHIVARYVDNQLLLTLVINGESKIDYTPLIEQLTERFEQFGLFININTKHNNVILGKITKHIYGLPYITSSQFGVNFTLRPDSFFQVNDDVKNKLYNRARELMGKSSDVVIDCFSGVGLLSGAMYSENYDMYAIEIDESSVADANELKANNNLARLTNICGDAVVELPKVLNKVRRENKSVALLVDPPRKGIGMALCQHIVKSAPDSIVYISCDSATLARDLSCLAEGYEVKLVEPYDMFPQTNHVETLVYLAKK